MKQFWGEGVIASYFSNTVSFIQG